MKHFFLTGDFQVGKSTLLKKVINELQVQKIGGFTTFTVWDLPDEKGSVYIGPAEVFLLSTSDELENAGQMDLFSRVGIRGGINASAQRPTPGTKGPTAYPEVFDHAGTEILKQAEMSQLIVMDEIGKMEQKAEHFCNRVRELLMKDTPVFGVLRKEGNTPLQEWIRTRTDIELIEVTIENRDLLKEKLTELLQKELNRRIDSAGAIVFRKDGDETQVLMICNRRGWAFPKGHIEAGEGVKETALREVFEETGIQIKLMEGFAYEASSGLPEEKRKVTYFLAEAVEGIPTPQLSEVRDVCWVKARDAEHRIAFPEDIPAFLTAWEAYEKNTQNAPGKDSKPV